MGLCLYMHNHIYNLSSGPKHISLFSQRPFPFHCSIGAFLRQDNDLCDDELMYLNFQNVDNDRSTKLNFFRRQNYDAGKNILLYRLPIINNKIDKSWLNLGLDSYKVKCKELFAEAKVIKEEVGCHYAEQYRAAMSSHLRSLMNYSRLLNKLLGIRHPR